MRAVIQRVKSASVTVEGKVVSQIGRGLVVLVGICSEDTFDDVDKLASTVLKLRLFESDDGSKMWQKSVTDLPKGQLLSVSQFTLYGNIKKGSKPDFHRAAKGHIALELYQQFLEKLKNGMKHVEEPETSVQDGVFGAMMDVALVNDGPVTINYDTKNPKDRQIENIQN